MNTLNRAGLWVLTLLVVVAGCKKDKSDSTTENVDPEVQLVADLGTAGQIYQDHIDATGRGPANRDAFLTFAAQQGRDTGFLTRLESQGYSILWSFNPRAGASMVNTVLAQSSSAGPRLMADGSLANVSRELLTQAREVTNRQLQKNSTPVQTSGGDSSLPQPTTPVEQASYQYLALHQQYLTLSRKIEDVESALRIYPSLRAMDSKFDAVGDALVAQGMRPDSFALPDRYQPVVKQIQAQQRAEDQRLLNLPQADEINQTLMSDAQKKGPLGPIRTYHKIQNSGNRTTVASGSPPSGNVTTKGLPANVSGTTPFKSGNKVEVEWGGTWYPAVVRQTKGNYCLIHYDNYGDSWDEWVPPNRIRKRQ